MKDTSTAVCLLTKFGIEGEFHAVGPHGLVDTSKHRLTDDLEPFGQLAADAGLGLGEVITNPGTYDDVISSLRNIFEALPRDWQIYHSVYRPEGVPKDLIWSEDARYAALREAVAVECPNTHHKIDQMVAVASTHLNVSGHLLDPLAPEGQLLMNVLTNAAPFIAAKIHEDLGEGAGHLSFWDFADVRRMPQWDRWHVDANSFIDEFEGKPKLIACMNEDLCEWQSLPRGHCSIYDPVDLGTYWNFVRPKLIPGTKRHYMEIRFLPAMPLDGVEVYTRTLWSICELIHQWHVTRHDLQPVSREAARELFPWLHGYHPDVFPDAMLTCEEWKHFLTL